MLKIGDFSALSKISIFMLRNYNEIGLLIPAHIDEATGHRYYSEEQLPIANRIQALKSMGLGLSIIKDILSEYNNEDSLKRYLSLQRLKSGKRLKQCKSNCCCFKPPSRVLTRVPLFPDLTLPLSNFKKEM